jgi:galactokinase
MLGVSSLRDLTVAHLDHRGSSLPEPLLRRARHVITENARVLAVVAALRSGDIAALAPLFAASHASMRDDFEVSVPPVDRLVQLARAEPDVVGARLTGGGFGGAVVLLVERGCGGDVAGRVADRYQESSGLLPRVLVPTA